MLELVDVSKTFLLGSGQLNVLDKVNLEIGPAQSVSIMGPSGSGKTTLLNLMGGLDKPTKGKVMLNRKSLASLREGELARLRNTQIGFVFQLHYLLPQCTVLENVLLPLAIVKADKARRHEMAAEALRQVGLENKIHRLPGQISGGESERVAIARAIVNEPPVLLADEPTGNLDSRTSRDIMELLQRLNNAGMTIVMVTHSAECAQYAERVLRVSDGRLLAN